MCVTGLLAATPPSMRLNSFPWFSNWWEGKNKGAAEVLMHMSDSKASIAESLGAYTEN